MGAFPSTYGCGFGIGGMAPSSLRSLGHPTLTFLSLPGGKSSCFTHGLIYPLLPHVWPRGWAKDLAGPWDPLGSLLGLALHHGELPSLPCPPRSG